MERLKPSPTSPPLPPMTYGPAALPVCEPHLPVSEPRTAKAEGVCAAGVCAGGSIGNRACWEEKGPGCLSLVLLTHPPSPQCSDLTKMCRHLQEVLIFRRLASIHSHLELEQLGMGGPTSGNPPHEERPPARWEQRQCVGGCVGGGVSELMLWGRRGR